MSNWILEEVGYNNWEVVKADVIYKCPKCGFSTNEDFNFCPNCGENMKEEQVDRTKDYKYLMC